jgi:hypothetical protein
MTVFTDANFVMEDSKPHLCFFCHLAQDSEQWGGGGCYIGLVSQLRFSFLQSFVKICKLSEKKIFHIIVIARSV